MSDYEDTVRSSLSNVDDEEILERLQKGALTEEAKVIALKILDERGYKQVDGDFIPPQSSVEQPEKAEAQEIKNEFSVLSLSVWIVFLFLIGISIPPSMHIPSEVAKSAFALVMGISFAVVGGVIAAIFLYKNRNKTKTRSKIVSNYKTNKKSLLVINGFIVLTWLYQLVRNGLSAMYIFYIAIIVGLTFFIYKKVSAANYALAAFSFISAVESLGKSSGSGILWGIIFFVSCQLIIAEKKYECIHSADV